MDQPIALILVVWMRYEGLPALTSCLLSQTCHCPAPQSPIYLASACGDPECGRPLAVFSFSLASEQQGGSFCIILLFLRSLQMHFQES